MPFCYIIYSPNLEKYYIGATQDNLAERIEKHNKASYGSHRFTSKANDWVLVTAFETLDYAHAVRIERKIKRMKSKIYIQNIVKYPELKPKIYNETLST